MIEFVIGLIVGISVSGIAMQIIQYMTQPMIGALLVDKSDPKNTCLYLKLETYEPDELSELKYVTMKVKNVDYFGDSNNS